MHLHTGERGEIMKIAVISDLHCSDTVITPANPPRHGHVADIGKGHSPDQQ